MIEGGCGGEAARLASASECVWTGGTGDFAVCVLIKAPTAVRQWSHGQHRLAIFGAAANARIDGVATLAAYQRHGQVALDTIEGPFIAIVSGPDHVAFARDLMGERSLFYHAVPGGMRFANALAPLAEAMDQRAMDPAALAQYLALSFVPAPRTMMRGVKALPAGTAVVWDGRGIGEPKRFMAPPAAGAAAPPTDPLRALRKVHGEAIATRLPADRNVALFLSGGIDSSAVAAELARAAPGRVRAFAVHFGRRYRNELAFAGQVARHLGIDYEEVELRPKRFLPRLHAVIRAVGNPIGDPITVPNYELAAIASRHASHVFNGEGGDPIFGGPKNLPMLLAQWYAPQPPSADELATTYLRSFRRAFDLLDGLLVPEVAREIDFDTHLLGLVRPYFEASQPPSILHRLQWMNCALKGANLILPKVEAMTAAHGLSVCSPLFDTRVARLGFRLAPTDKLRAGIEKRVLREAYRGALPDAIVDRPKSGMRVPVHFWFRREMRRHVRHVFRPAAVRRAGLFQPEAVARLLEYDPEVPGGRYGIRLWMLLTLEVWRRIFIEGE